jgi:hypothetical protein
LENKCLQFGGLIIFFRAERQLKSVENFGFAKMSVKLEISPTYFAKFFPDIEPWNFATNFILEGLAGLLLGLLFVNFT